MTELIAMLILAAAASAGLLYWLRPRPRRREVWLPTQPMRSAKVGPAPPSESAEAARLRRHMAVRVQLAWLARESAREKPPEPADHGFAETEIQDEPRG
jgi:hypothetical protein